MIHYKWSGLAALLLCLLRQTAFADTRLIRDLDVWEAFTGDYNASFWLEQGGLHTGVPLYGDRTVTITRLPKQLSGADWIQTAAGSATSVLETLATFSLAGDARVYIALHHTASPPPAWLQAWHTTKLTLSTSNGEELALFAADFHTGDTVRLGRNPEGDTTMYSVIVLPLGASPPVARPAGPVFDANTYGAKGDDHTLNTSAIQSAIDACTVAGGGTVYLHDGIFITGSLVLKDKVTLFVAAGSILRGSPNPADYTPQRCTLPSYRGKEDYQLIYAEGRHDIGITGGGIIDGFSHGGQWPWKNEKNANIIDRPRLIRMVSCKDVTVTNISLLRSAYWTQYYEDCEGLRIRHERVRCYTGQDNEDGIDISGCRDVTLQDYYAITGDDAVCIKTMSPAVCANLDIRDVFIRYANCHAVKIGTETHSDVRHVHVHNVVAAARYGTAIETVDGATVEDILYDSIRLTTCGVPLFIRLGNRYRTYDGGPHPPPHSVMRNITIRHLVNTGIGFVPARDGPGVGSSITGMPDQPIEHLVIEDCRFLYYGSRTDTALAGRAIPEQEKAYPEFNVLGLGPAYGPFFRHVRSLTLRNDTIQCLHPDVRPAIVLDNVTGYTMSNVHCDSFPDTKPSLIWDRQNGVPTAAARRKLAEWPQGFSIDSVSSSLDKAWQRMYVYRSTASTSQPLVISLHTWSGNYLQQDSLAGETLAKNWNYIHPDFRGESNKPEGGGSDLAIHDIDDAIDWACSHWPVDTSRIYVVGVSGGGFATLCCYGRLHHHVASFTAWVPISDLGAWYYESLNLTAKYAANVLAVTRSTPDRLNQAEIVSRSPLFHAVPRDRLNHTPLTILAGVHDGHGKNSVPVTQSMLYYNKLLREKGVKDPKAYITEKDILTVLTQQRFPVTDSTYIGGRLIHYQKKYGNIRLVLFEGGHEMLYTVGAIPQ